LTRVPVGGIKDPGYGSEGWPKALDQYLNVRAVAMVSVHWRDIRNLEFDA
jgi:acyl-CoA reductase-like NAD-dependent aldehyde dehydrogenase